LWSAFQESRSRGQASTLEGMWNLNNSGYVSASLIKSEDALRQSLPLAVGLIVDHWKLSGEERLSEIFYSCFQSRTLSIIIIIDSPLFQTIDCRSDCSVVYSNPAMAMPK
jgi:hypothetical protein